AKRKAKDRIDMERHLQIKNEINDLSYLSVYYRSVFRKKFKALKLKIKMLLGFKKHKA
ncbi:lipopolysaccharide core heptose(II) kinase RfaY, partial [Obesumbacterium proteus]